MPGPVLRSLICLPLLLAGCATAKPVRGPPPADLAEAQPVGALRPRPKRRHEIIYANREPIDEQGDERPGSGMMMGGPDGGMVPVGPQSVSTDTQVSYGHSLASYGH